MREHGWKRVATIHQNHELFSLAIENFLSLVDAVNFTIVTSETIGKDPRVSVTNVKLNDAKIIFVSMYKHMARLIICEAYKSSMTGSGYVWIMYGWYDAFWWREENNEVECTVEEMDEAILSATIFTIDRSNMSPSENPTIAQLSPPELEKELRQRFLWPANSRYSYSEYSPNGYDAAWAIALMLNRSSEVLKNKVFANGKKRRLEEFTYDDWEMASLFLDLLNETDFTGMSGNIIFKGGDLWGDSKIGQMQGYEQVEVGLYSIAGDRFEWKTDVIWKDGYVPIDHTAIIREFRGLSLRLYFIISALAGIGLCTAGFFFGFNIKYRTQRNVKMSSPNLNNIIIVGSILIYASVIVGGLDSNLVSMNIFEIACQVSNEQIF
ncbi:gamma-aminobutyric acid type B receptor subunit 2-like [Amphiura filiformis]|uniref:gamma-aminobutyric acid type B receptor subunit 2-like n=1 Tax=Amphiura filiformis TaxID=82378 RepID=UPI003B22514C